MALRISDFLLPSELSSPRSTTFGFVRRAIQPLQVNGRLFSETKLLSRKTGFWTYSTINQMFIVRAVDRCVCVREFARARVCVYVCVCVLRHSVCIAIVCVPQYVCV